MIIIGLFLYIIILLCPPIIGLVLSSIGIKKKRNPFNITGLTLNIIALSLQIFRLLIYITKIM